LRSLGKRAVKRGQKSPVDGRGKGQRSEPEKKKKVEYRECSGEGKKKRVDFKRENCFLKKGES